MKSYIWISVKATATEPEIQTEECVAWVQRHNHDQGSKMRVVKVSDTKMKDTEGNSVMSVTVEEDE